MLFDKGKLGNNKGKEARFCVSKQSVLRASAGSFWLSLSPCREESRGWRLGLKCLGQVQTRTGSLAPFVLVYLMSQDIPSLLWDFFPVGLGCAVLSPVTSSKILGAAQGGFAHHTRALSDPW